ncbi:MAG: M2 family metallopeptidase [Polyangiales bacterium]
MNPRRILFSALATLTVAACGAEPSGGPAPATPTSPPSTTTTTTTTASSTSGSAAATSGPTLDDAKKFYATVDAELRKRWVAAQKATWVNETYITDDTDDLATLAQESSMAYLGEAIPASRKFDAVLSTSANPQPPADLARMHHNLRLSTTLPAPLDAVKRKELAALSVQLTSMYGKGKYCPARLAKEKDEKKRCLTLDDLEKTLATSRKYDELLDAWTGWHSISPPMREKYARYVGLANEGAKAIGFEDVGQLWRSMYDMPPEQFAAEMERLWQQVKPLYDELHCYVRGKLRKQYGKDKVPDKGPIPAHLLGNMWAQEWADVYSMVEPYPGQGSIDVVAKMKAKKLDEKGVVKIAEGFFTSLGMDPLPATFWERSLFKRPADRDVVCHASAWDVTYDGDLRIKMCVQINGTDLLTAHHELGHDYYYMQYHTLPILFQDGANDGFHEAIGDAIALSATPGYLKKIGLLDVAPNNPKAEVNVLMKRALEKVAFLPFGRMLDQWRWDVFSGKTQPAQYNAAYWALREKYQGVSAPVPRSEQDFDPGAKFHVASSTPYARYFLAAIYQFQFHRALCKAAGYTGPLDGCSIYESKAAGAKLKAMLALGSSKPWPEALATLSGETAADATAMLEYFAPLRKFLQEQNKGETCGW